MTLDVSLASIALPHMLHNRLRNEPVSVILRAVVVVACSGIVDEQAKPHVTPTVLI